MDDKLFIEKLNSIFNLDIDYSKLDEYGYESVVLYGNEITDDLDILEPNTPYITYQFLYSDNDLYTLVTNDENDENRENLILGIYSKLDNDGKLIKEEYFPLEK